MKNRRSKLTEANVPSNNITASNESPSTPIEPRGRISRGRPASRGSAMANTLRNIGNSLFDEIMMPSIKSTMSDFVTTFINSLIFSDNRDEPRRSGRGRSQHTSYNRRYRSGTARGRQSSRRGRPVRRATETYDQFEDIFFQYQQDAQLVLDKMKDLIDDYEVATILDLYTMVGSYSDVTHQRWGWTNLRGIRVVPSSEGYLIDFPEPVYLN